MAIKDFLFNLSDRMQRAIVPELRYSQTTFEERLRPQAMSSTMWLDLGCGHRLLPEWREAEEKAMIAGSRVVVGVDTDFQAIRRHRSFSNLSCADISRLPFAAGSFDLVTANMVVEHLEAPEQQFAEVARVLKPGGRFVFHTPNRDSYIVMVSRWLPDVVKRFLARLLEGRAGVDVYETFYRANSPASIAAAAGKAGLVVDDIEYSNSTPVFRLIAPLVIPELVWLRQLQRRPSLAKYRATLICRLRKPA